MDELEKIQLQIAELQKKAQEIAQANRIPVLEDVKNKIKLYGFTPEELGFQVEAKPNAMAEKKKKVVAVKYRLGNNTWTGRGKKPKWVEEYLAAGKALDDILVST